MSSSSSRPNSQETSNPSDSRSFAVSLHPITDANSTFSSVWEEEESEDEDRLSKTKRKVNKKCKDFLYFKPKRDQGLYKELAEQGIEGSEVLAKNILDSLKEMPLTAFQTLLEYFFDLCGYQHVNIRERYNNRTINFGSIVATTQGDTSNEHKNGYYLFKGKSKYAEELINICLSFVKDLVLNDEELSLFQINKPNSVLSLIHAMCHSNFRAICHTGAMIAIKMNSAYCNMSITLNSNDDLRNINRIQKYLWECIRFVSNKQDHFLESMRQEAAKEMWFWFKKRPEYFLQTDDYVKYVLRFSTDLSVKVRLAFLETCNRIFACHINNVYHYFKSFKNQVLNEVIGRIDDINLNVVCKAIDVCTNILQMDTQKIIPIDRIICLIFTKYHPLAAACGRFFICYLRIATTSPHDFLNRIFQICKMADEENIVDFDTLVILFVDATIDSTPHLQNWDIFIDNLVTETNFDLEMRYFLLDFFCQCVIQTLTGRCKLKRQQPRREIVKESNNKAVLNIFITHINTLVNLYWKRKNSILTVLKVLNVVDYSQLEESEENNKKMDLLYNNLLSHFRKSTDLDVALKLLQTFNIFYNTDNQFQTIAKCCWTTFKISLLEDLNKVMNDESIVNKRKFCNIWLCIAAVMEVTEINTEICWIQIFNKNCKKNVACLKYQLMAYRWYIVKKVESFLQINYVVDENDVAWNELNKEVQEYAEYLINLLIGDIEDVSVQAFQEICDIRYIMENILIEPIKNNRNLSLLLINFSDNNVIDRFINILIKFVINNLFSVSSSTREKYLMRATYLFKDKLYKYLHRIIYFYGACYNELGHIFDKILNDLKSNAQLSFVLLVHETLMYAFKKTNFDLNNLLHSMKNARELKQLTKQIIDTCVKNSSEALPIVEFSIKYIKQHLDDLHFFFVLKYFVERLDVDECVFFYNMLKDMIPSKYQNNPGFLDFKTALKVKLSKPKKMIKAGNTKKSTSSTDEETDENYTIHDSSDD